jgi:hypothetical protein
MGYETTDYLEGKLSFRSGLVCHLSLRFPLQTELRLLGVGLDGMAKDRATISQMMKVEACWGGISGKWVAQARSMP